MGGKIQNEDIKSLSQLTGLGADKTKLLNTDKMYTPKSDEVLETVLRKNNYSAAVDPTDTDDTNAGYEPGSVWINTTSGKAFTCVANAAGAAIWIEGGAGGAGKLNFITIGTQEDAALSDYDTGNSADFGDSGALAGALSLADDTESLRGDVALKYVSSATAGDNTNDWVKRRSLIPRGYQRTSILEFALQFVNEFVDGNVRLKAVDSNGKVLLDDPLNSYTGSASEEYKRQLVIDDGVTYVDWGFQVVNGEASKKILLDDVILTPEIGFKEQVVLEQRPDSMIRVHTGNGHGSTNTHIRRFSTLVDSLGSAVSYEDSAADGASFTIQENGVYHITYMDGRSDNLANFGLSVNSNQLTTNIVSITSNHKLTHNTAGATNFEASCSWSGYLNKGDIVRAHTDSTTDATAGNDFAQFTIAKIGSVAQIPVGIDQKIKIPTSEMRIEGSSSRGTGSETLTAKFDTIAKITGEALSVNSSNGTVITINKDGLLHVGVTLAHSTTSVTTAITKNASNPGSFPADSEVMASHLNSSSAADTNVVATFEVKEGDKIRVACDATPNDIRNSLNLIHIDKEIAISLNTVKPQFEDADSLVRVGSSTSRGSVNTSVFRWNNVFENIGSAITYTPSATEGDSFTINEDGHYDIEAGIAFQSGGAWFRITKNDFSSTGSANPDSNMLAMGYTEQAAATHNAGYSGRLSKGDVIRVISESGDDPHELSFFAISKKSNPSVVGIDGRSPEVFVETSDSEVTVYDKAGYGTTGTRVYRFVNLLKNLGSAISYEQDSVNGDRFICEEDGVYHIMFTDDTDGDNYGIGVSVNASSLTAEFGSLPAAEKLTAMNYDNTGASRDTVSGSFVLKKGDIVRAHGHNVGSASGGSFARFTITKIGQLKRAAPVSDQTIDIPTSELRMHGTLGKGSTDTFIVRFDSINKLAGDDLTVTSDAASGTVLTVQKDGLLHLYAKTSVNTAGMVLGFSKNQATRTTYPTESEQMSFDQKRGLNAGDAVEVSTHTFVKAGDQIRMWSDGAIATSAGGFLVANFVQTKTEVKLSNIEPQYEDVDSAIIVHTGNGRGSTGTAIRRFAAIHSIIGSAIDYVDSATDGASFIAKEDGIYHVTWAERNNSASQNFGISVNADIATSIGSLNASTGLKSFSLVSNTINARETTSWTGYLKKGDVVRPHTDSGVTLDDDEESVFTMARISRPSITAADLQGFLEAPVTDIQNIEYRGGNGHGSTNTFIRRFSDELRNESGPLIASNDSAEGMSLRATKDCYVTVTYQDNESSGGTSEFGLSLNSSELTTNIASISSNDRLAVGKLTGSSIGGAVNYQVVSWAGKLKRGDVLRPHTNGSLDDDTFNTQRFSAVAWAKADHVISELDSVAPTRVTSSNSQVIGESATTVVFENVDYDDDLLYNSSTGQWTAKRDGIIRLGAALNFGSSSQWGNGEYGRMDVYINGNIGPQLDYKSTDGASTTYNLRLGGDSEFRVQKNDVIELRARAVNNAGGKNISGSDDHNYMTISYVDKLSLALLNKRKVAYVKDIKSSGTQGGTFTSGAWRTRDLNTLEGDTDFISLNANQFTIEAGTYEIEIDAPAFEVIRHQAKLYNISNTSDEIIGQNAYLRNPSAMSTSVVKGRLVLTEATTFEVQHRCGTTVSNVGFGVEMGWGDEVYTQVKIEKLK